MKLYVWEDCFRDWNAGLGVVLANDAEEARDLLSDLIGYRHEDLAKRPTEYNLDKPKAFCVFGGG